MDANPEQAGERRRPRWRKRLLAYEERHEKVNGSSGRTTRS